MVTTMLVKWRYFILFVAVVFAAGLAIGRYSVKPEIKTVTQTQVQTDKKEETDVHTVVKVVRVKDPAGVITTTTTTTDSTTRTDSTTESNAKSTVETTPQARKRFNVSAIGYFNPWAPGAPSYGIGIQREVIGPVTVGLFTLTNGTIGLSVGLNF